MKIWSVELRSDDLFKFDNFSGTYEECADYCAEHDYSEWEDDLLSEFGYYLENVSLEDKASIWNCWAGESQFKLMQTCEGWFGMTNGEKCDFISSALEHFLYKNLCNEIFMVEVLQGCTYGVRELENFRDYVSRMARIVEIEVDENDCFERCYRIVNNWNDSVDYDKVQF